MLVVSGLEMGESLVARTRLMTLGHSHLFTWCSPASCALTERVYSPPPYLRKMLKTQEKLPA